MITQDNVMNKSPYKDIMYLLFISERNKPIRRAHLVKNFVKTSKHEQGIEYKPSDITGLSISAAEQSGMFSTKKKFTSVGGLNKALQKLKDLDLITSEKRIHDYPIIKLTDLGYRVYMVDYFKNTINSVPNREMFDDLFHTISVWQIKMLKSKKFKMMIKEMMERKK